MNDIFYWKYVDQQLFHVTSVYGYSGIRKKGALLPNSGERDFSFEKSKISYAKKNGYIALFDFHACPDDKIVVTKAMWSSIIATHKPAIVLTFNINELNDKLIPASTIDHMRADPNFMGKNYHVPCVEAWYPEPISKEKIARAYKIDAQLKKIECLTK